MQDAHRSGCPINLTLEVLGDRWSLIVIRDVIFGDRRRYRELLTRSEEGIASNVLADRLKRLVAAGLVEGEVVVEVGPLPLPTREAVHVRELLAERKLHALALRGVQGPDEGVRRLRDLRRRRGGAVKRRPSANPNLRLRNIIRN